MNMNGPAENMLYTSGKPSYLEKLNVYVMWIPFLTVDINVEWFSPLEISSSDYPPYFWSGVARAMSTMGDSDSKVCIILQNGRFRSDCKSEVIWRM